MQQLRTISVSRNLLEELFFPPLSSHGSVLWSSVQTGYADGPVPEKYDCVAWNTNAVWKVNWVYLQKVDFLKFFCLTSHFSMNSSSCHWKLITKATGEVKKTCALQLEYVIKLVCSAVFNIVTLKWMKRSFNTPICETQKVRQLHASVLVDVNVE